MVCFSQHGYNFDASNADAWFKALAKYHSGVKAAVTIDEERSYTTKIDLKWLQSLPKGRKYNVTTKCTWNKRATIQAMPQYISAAEGKKTSGHSKTLVTNITSTIDRIIALHLGHSSQEIFISSDFKEGTTFDRVVSAIGFLKNTKKLTQLFISHDSKCVILVLDDCYMLCAHLSGVCDMGLPTLDLNDRFVQNTFNSAVMPKEWNRSFKVWRVAFNNSNRQTWDAPIITPSA